jgi:hypothetical protein
LLNDALGNLVIWSSGHLIIDLVMYVDLVGQSLIAASTPIRPAMTTPNVPSNDQLTND